MIAVCAQQNEKSPSWRFLGTILSDERAFFNRLLLPLVLSRLGYGGKR